MFRFQFARLVIATLAVALLQLTNLNAAEKLKVIVITGGHGYNAKEFSKWFPAQEDMEFTITPNKKGNSAFFDNIDKWEYDAIVLYNLRQTMTDTQKKNFLSLLSQGVGLVVLHHAIAAYNEWWEYPKIMGATYLMKAAERDGVKYARPTYKHNIDMKIHVEDTKHPIMAGIEDFEVNDETYKGWTYHKGNHLLLTTDNKLSNKQIAWTRDYKGAKVFFMQLGHGPHTYNSRACQLIVARAIRWTIGRLK